jgi:hypothetical protein
MKTEEDEAFDELAKRQGDWGGGFHAKRAAAADKLQGPVEFDAFLESQDFYELMQTYRHCQIDAHIPFEAVKDALRAVHIEAALEQPAQKPAGMLHIERLDKWLDASLKERKREWVGLTDAERKAALLPAYEEWECDELLLCAREDYLLIEKALEEKNT